MIIKWLENLQNNKLSNSFLQIWHLANQVAIYTDGSQPLEWRETSQLPSPRVGLKAAVVDNVLYVTGGFHTTDFNIFTSILLWNPSTETWQPAGELSVERDRPAVVAVPSSILSSECSEI